MYTIKQVATLTGTTPRTLRYYDAIGLFSPAYIGENGYRMYEVTQLDQLQHILFLKQFGLSLDKIKQSLTASDDEQITLLTAHYQELLKEQTQLEQLLNTLKQTIAYRKGETHMSTEEKFEAFKTNMIQENNDTYGEEITKKYGKTSLHDANHHMKHLNQADYQNMLQAEIDLFDSLNTLENLEEYDLDHPLAKKAFMSHKNWLNLATPHYSPTYHQQLVDMYLADERFSAYYTKSISQNSLEFLKKIVYYYTSEA